MAGFLATRAAATSLVLLSLLSAAGCSSADAPMTALPEGVSIGVQQNRADFAPRRIQVVVTNETGSDLTVESVTLESDQFEDAVTSTDIAALVSAGRTVHLPLQLPATDCTTDTADPAVRIELTLDGEAVDAVVTPEDRFERLPQLREEDCLRSAVDGVAALTLETPLVVSTTGGFALATATLSVAPTGKAGSFTLDTVAGTTLVAVADPASGVIEPLRPVGIEVQGTDAPTSVEIALVPNRCDAHAIAEDKRGSVLPLDVTTDEFGSGRIFITATDEVRASIYDFVRSACGLS